MELDPRTMALTRWHEFDDYGGSLTWIVRRGNRWLCNFAKYGDQNKDSFLVEFDNRFKEQRRWSYPSELIDKLGKYSLSGGVWFRGELLVTGHDAEEVYALSFPRTGPINNIERAGAKASEPMSLSQAQLHKHFALANRYR